MQSLYTRIYKDLRKTTLLTQAAVLSIATVLPFVMMGLASAAPQVTERELQASTAIPADTGVTLTWIFDTTDLGGSTNVDHIEIEFCDTPLGTCNTEVGNADNGATDGIPQLPGSPTATLSGPWSSTGNTTTRVAGDGGGTQNQLLIDKTTADNTNNANELQIAIGGFTNDDEANQSYYTRMRLYSDTGTTLVWEGVFAQSTAQTLNVSARVQERLDFCVGATVTDTESANLRDSTDSADIASCADVDGTNVDLGVVDANPSITPVTTGDEGNNTNGLALINTNAVVGTTVQYAAIQESGITNGPGRLKVDGAECDVSATSTTDQCFTSLTTAGALTGESFGMTIAGVNCDVNSGAGYTCDYTAGDTSIGPVAAFTGGTYTAGTSGTYGHTQFRWDEGGSYVTIAQTSSAGTGTHVIDNEALILVFGAQAALTTPTGLYDVDADFVATPTF